MPEFEILLTTCSLLLKEKTRQCFSTRKGLMRIHQDVRTFPLLRLLVVYNKKLARDRFQGTRCARVEMPLSRMFKNCMSMLIWPNPLDLMTCHQQKVPATPGYTWLYENICWNAHHWANQMAKWVLPNVSWKKNSSELAFPSQAGV